MRIGRVFFYPQGKQTNLAPLPSSSGRILVCTTRKSTSLGAFSHTCVLNAPLGLWYGNAVTTRTAKARRVSWNEARTQKNKELPLQPSGGGNGAQFKTSQEASTARLRMGSGFYHSLTVLGKTIPRMYCMHFLRIILSYILAWKWIYFWW